MNIDPEKSAVSGCTKTARISGQSIIKLRFRSFLISIFLKPLHWSAEYSGKQFSNPAAIQGVIHVAHNFVGVDSCKLETVI